MISRTTPSPSSEPMVSVVIPAYNLGKYLAQTLDSVLRQTYKTLECLVIDDASTDNTLSIAEKYRERDGRVRVFSHTENRGVSEARNTGLGNIQGAFVAILDGDDMATPNRIACQVAALCSDQSLGMVGSQVAVLDESGQSTGIVWERPVDPDHASIGLLFRNTFSSAVLLRREAIPDGGYRLPMAEDYDFNARVASKWKVRNLKEALTCVRVRNSGLTHSKPQLMEECLRDILCRLLAEVGVEATAAEMDVHRHVGDRHLPPSVDLLDDVESWLLKLSAANHVSQRYRPEAFRRVLCAEWFQVCMSATRLGGATWSKCTGLPLWRASDTRRMAWWRLAVKCLLRHQRVGAQAVNHRAG